MGADNVPSLVQAQNPYDMEEERPHRLRKEPMGSQPQPKTLVEPSMPQEEPIKEINLIEEDEPIAKAEEEILKLRDENRRCYLQQQYIGQMYKVKKATGREVYELFPRAQHSGQTMADHLVDKYKSTLVDHMYES